MKRILLASLLALSFSYVNAKSEVLCPGIAKTAEEGEKLYQEYLYLINRGYVPLRKEFTRTYVHSYGGIGIYLKTDFDKSTRKMSGTIAVGPAVHGSPADKTGMFPDAATAYRIKAVNGVSVSGLDSVVVGNIIRGDPGGSVVITFSRYNSERSFDRYFPRARLSSSEDVLCKLFVLPEKK